MRPLHHPDEAKAIGNLKSAFSLRKKNHKHIDG